MRRVPHEYIPVLKSEIEKLQKAGAGNAFNITVCEPNNFSQTERQLDAPLH